ncbi:hypothetical protein [uncultured phage MedDCM-OCT-S08-C1441]|nr:hypothetical protein [uncultured phage MedDCM-OCT-S08-C1441]
MSISPGTYNFALQRRADWSVLLQFKDSNDAAISLVGATVAAQAWDKPRSNKYADFGVAYTNRADGQVTLSLSDTDTTTSLTSCTTTSCHRQHRPEGLLLRRRDRG